MAYQPNLNDPRNSLMRLHTYVESEEFLQSPRYEQYAEDALRTAKKKLKMFDDSPFKHNEKFSERLDQILYNICVIELMQYEYKEQNSFFNAHWDKSIGAENQLPDIDYLYYKIDEQIDQLCHWGESHAYE